MQNHLFFSYSLVISLETSVGVSRPLCARLKKPKHFSTAKSLFLPQKSGVHNILKKIK